MPQGQNTIDQEKLYDINPSFVIREIPDAAGNFSRNKKPAGFRSNMGGRDLAGFFRYGLKVSRICSITQPFLHRPGGDLGAVVEAQFAHNVGDVPFGSALTEDEFLGDKVSELWFFLATKILG